MASEQSLRLYEQPLPSGRHGPLYNAFSYPTKISAESVALFIACHTQPGDRVLDVFGGSCSTAVAARLCARPTPRMLGLAEQAGVSPTWGPRDAVVYEISVIGSLLGEVMSSPPDPCDFAAAARRVLSAGRERAPDLYATTDAAGQPGEIRHIVWSDVVACPDCRRLTTYADVRVRWNPLCFADTNKCECGYQGHPDDWVRRTAAREDPWTGVTAEKRERVPWRVYGRAGSRRWSRPATADDAITEREVASRPLPDSAPIAPLVWGDLHRSGYHQGMTQLHDLYTARNFWAMALLWDLAGEEPEHLRDALRVWLLSYNQSHSTLMTRVVLKRDSKDFVLTGAQSGVLYVSGLPVEKNVFNGLERKIGVFERAFEMVSGTGGVVTVVNGSSTELDLPNGSVDYVFTDPPFGGYIPYSEINQINELWLGQTTEKVSEAIVSRAQGKDVADYEALLSAIFAETSRVMKPDANATVVFHSAHVDVWRALTRSLDLAGLGVKAANVLDKTQGSFKQVSQHVSVSGDPLILLRKNVGEDSWAERAMPDVADLIIADQAIVSASRRDGQHAFSRFVAASLVRGEPITLGAREFRPRRAGEATA